MTKRQRDPKFPNTEVLAYSTVGHDIRVSSQQPKGPEASSLEGINRDACVYGLFLFSLAVMQNHFLAQKHTWPITAANSVVNICLAKE